MARSETPANEGRKAALRTADPAAIKAFIKKMEEVAAEVSTWPAWKQEALGGTASTPKSSGAQAK
ncbi:MAG: hypothetical protein SGJ09_09595 [Phycisphaerae bacterium]|nr:hypothetical protein [Phycisphaerae bacterium]